MSPAVSVYQRVSDHIVALVSCRRPQPPQPKRPRAWPSSDTKPTRAFSVESLTTADTTSDILSSSDSDEPRPLPSSPRASLRGRPTRNDPDREDHGLSEAGYALRDWRVEQAVCVHCRALFFVTLTPSGAFCSLDCRTSFHFQRAIDQTTQSSFWVRPTLSLGKSNRFSEDSEEEEDWLPRDDVRWSVIQQDHATPGAV